MLVNIGAQCVAALASFRRDCQFSIHLVANLQANRGRSSKAVIVAAGVQPRCDVEERLAGFKRDGRPSGIRLRNPRWRRGFSIVRSWIVSAAAGRGRALLCCCEQDGSSKAKREGKNKGDNLRETAMRRWFV